MSVLLFLLPLGLIFDLFGYMAPSLRLFLVYGLLALPLCLRPSRRSGWLGGLLVAAMLLRSWLDLPEVAGTALLLLLHQAIWALVAPVPKALRTGVAAYAMLHVFLFVSPLGHPVVEWLSASLNRVAGWITGNPFHLGWTWQNLGAFLLFLTLSVFSWDGSRVAYLRSGIFLLVACLLSALASTLLIDKVDFTASYSWELEFREPFGFAQLGEHLGRLLLLVFPGLVFLVAMAAYLVLHHGKGRRAGVEADDESIRTALRREWPSGWRAPLVFALAAAFALVAVPLTNLSRPQPPTLVFLNRGVVSFTSPDYTRFGQSAGGMFGMLPEYARLFGCETSVVTEVPESLEPGEVLVVTNLDEDLGAETEQRIWDFVAAGGALWVLGDHTFIKNGRNHLNDLLEPCHISFNNDSAQFFPQGWFHSYRFRQGTPFGGLRDDAENRPGLLVGASLDLGVPAEPFVLGRYGYSDWGLAEPDGQRGHLGDFEYQSSERLGDLVLVAGEQHGKGRVLVFGDTSSFFNVNLARSYELLRASLSWLGESPRWSWPASLPGRILAAGLLLGLLGTSFAWRGLPVAIAPLLGAGLVSWLGHGGRGLLPYDEGFSRGRLALIDYSMQPFASKHSSMPSGLYGVAINMQRYQLLPATMNEWDENLLDQARFLVLNAPREPIAEDRRRALMDFMERGGTLILACGYQEAPAAEALLEPLGLRVGGTPLGRFFDRPAFGRPISFLCSWMIAQAPPAAEVLCSAGDWPLIVQLPVGDGELVLIPDSEFLHNRNLEGHENHDPANTDFLKNLFDHVSQ